MIKRFTNPAWDEATKSSKDHSNQVDGFLKEESAKYSYNFSSFLPDKESIFLWKNWISSLEAQNVDTLILVGIGGSSLGTQLFYDFYKKKNPDNLKKIFFWESTYQTQVEELKWLIKNRKCALLWISKSGSTLETNVNYTLFRKIFPLSNLIEGFITSDLSKLEQYNISKNKVFLIPENISGRFSIHSAVGLIPLLFLSSKSFDDFIQSFRISDAENSIETPYTLNKAKQIANNYYKLGLKGYNKYTFWNYVYELEFFGPFLRQLWSESLGKKEALDLNLSLCTGSKDQHSVLQYHLNFFQNSVHSFFTSIKSAENIGSEHIAYPNKDDNKNITDILNETCYSTMFCLNKRSIPLSLYKTPEIIDIKSIADLINLWMYIVSYLGFFMQVNPYDQPSVEEVKNQCKSRLSSKNPEELLFLEEKPY